jgi:membrane-associated phospholipid phosphatase
MKQQSPLLGFFLALLRRPRLKRSDIFLTLVPIALWILTIQLRSIVITPHCVKEPSACTAEALLPLDRPALNLEAPDADAYSFATQNTAGYLAMGVPAVWNGFLAMSSRMTPLGALIATGTDLVIFAQSAAWNGLATETIRLVAQRPRPFVYADPAERGKNPAHYASFPSGHTSFAAAASVFLILCLLGRGAPAWLIGAAFGVGQCLVTATAIFRVLAGRHFITDTLMAMLLGSLVSLYVALAHRKKTSEPE